MANSRRKSALWSASRARAIVPITGVPAALRFDGLAVEERGPVGRGALAVPQDELLDHLPRRVVAELDRRRFHEVRARPDQRTGDATIQRELRAADGVDHDAGGVGAVPHLELEL